MLVEEAWKRPHDRCSPYPLQVRVYPESRDGKLFSISEQEAKDCLSYYTGAKFSATITGEQAATLGDRMLRSGKPIAT